MSTKGNIVGRLLEQAAARPGKTAFIVLTDGAGAEQKISYAALAARVQALAARPSVAGLRGACVLLVYQDVLEFIVAFLACQYAGVIAVPVACPNGRKRAARLAAIIADAGATTILCTSDLTALPEGLDEKFQVIATDKADDGVPGLPAHPRTNDTAFIQYTSGSTGQPKGVVVRASSLWHNQQLLQKAFGCTPASVILSWLPFHHDMGLTGNILHSIYTGCTCVLMSPLQFVQKPLNWLKAISTYKVTHSGGPNFAYSLCAERIGPADMAGLDLSSWAVAYNGSEPIRQETIRRFSQQFGPAGFSLNAYTTCYGLAEATLLVSAHKRDGAPGTLFFQRGLESDNRIVLCGADEPEAVAVVSSGSVVDGMELRIVSARDGCVCNELEEGEICIAGESVTEGYWNRDNSDYFYTIDGRSFLRTGDLGFTLDNELYVHGRLKEMLIVRGRNFYPQDIEEAIANADESIEPNGVAVFGKAAMGEAFVVVAEIRRNAVHKLDAAAVFSRIENEVAASFGISPYDIILTTPMGIPRTTSGKLQRLHCRMLYADGGFTVLAARRASMNENTMSDASLLEAVRDRPDYTNLKNYLAGAIASKLPAGTRADLDDATPLADTGLDSLRMMELINTINHDLNITIDAGRVLQADTVEGLVKLVETVLWLKNKQPFGSEITI